MNLNFRVMRVFFVGIFLAGLIAVVINGLMAPTQMTEWAQEILAENNGHGQFQIEKAEISLADGPWPEWALNLHGLSWKNDRSCAFVDGVSSHRLKVKFKFLSLLRGKLSFDKIVLSHVNLRLNPESCRKVEAQKNGLRPFFPDQAEKEKVLVRNEKVLEAMNFEAQMKGQKETTQGAGQLFDATKSLGKARYLDHQKLNPAAKNSQSESGKKVAQLFAKDKSRAIGKINEHSRWIDDIKQNWPSFKHTLSAKWSQRVSPLRDWVDAIEIDQMVIEDATHDQKKLTFNDLSLVWTDASLNTDLLLSGNLNLAPHLVLHEPVKAFEFKSTIGPERIDLVLNGGYYEGHLVAAVGIDFNQARFKLDVKLSQLPINQLSSALNRGGVLPIPFSPKLTWFSCHMNSQGSLLNLRTTKVTLSPCGVVGGIGKLTLSEVNYQPFLQSDKKLNAFKVKLEDLDVGQLIKSVGRVGPSGIFSRFGKVNGSILWSDKNTVQINGVAEDMVLYFSNRGERAHQKIKSLAMNIALKDNRFSGLLNDLVINDGVFKGAISFNVNRSVTEGILRMNVDQFQLNSAVQQLMVLGQMKPLAIYGQAKIVDGEITHWKGDIGTNEIISEKWNVGKTKIKVVFEKEEMKGHVTIDDILFHKNHSFQEWMTPLFLDDEIKQGPLKFTSLSSNLVIRRRDGQWNRTLLKSDKIVFTSNGKWSRTLDEKGNSIPTIKAALKVAMPGFKAIRWKMSGIWNQLKVFPDVRDLKAMAKVEAERKILLEAQKPLLNRIFKNTPVQFRSIREKVIKSANQWMGKDKAGQKLDKNLPIDSEGENEKVGAKKR